MATQMQQNDQSDPPPFTLDCERYSVETTRKPKEKPLYKVTREERLRGRVDEVALLSRGSRKFVLDGIRHSSEVANTKTAYKKKAPAFPPAPPLGKTPLPDIDAELKPKPTKTQQSVKRRPAGALGYEPTSTLKQRPDYVKVTTKCDTKNTTYVPKSKEAPKKPLPKFKRKDYSKVKSKLNTKNSSYKRSGGDVKILTGPLPKKILPTLEKPDSPKYEPKWKEEAPRDLTSFRLLNKLAEEKKKKEAELKKKKEEEEWKERMKLAEEKAKQRKAAIRQQKRLQAQRDTEAAAMKAKAEEEKRRKEEQKKITGNADDNGNDNCNDNENENEENGETIEGAPANADTSDSPTENPPAGTEGESPSNDSDPKNNDETLNNNVTIASMADSNDKDLVVEDVSNKKVPKESRTEKPEASKDKQTKS